MKILFLSSETPFFPGGGIGVYLHYVVKCLEAAGHEAYLMTWCYKAHYVRPSSFDPFQEDRVHIELVTSEQLMQGNRGRKYTESLSHVLSDAIVDLAERWQIDVIESVDFHAPGLTAFQKLQASGTASRYLLSTYNHGTHEGICDANQIYPLLEDQSTIIAERKLFAASDIVIAPSMRAKHLLQNTLGVRTPIKVVREPYLFRNPYLPDIQPKGIIQYQGRLSLQKGMDRICLIANIINTVLPIERIDLIGSERKMNLMGQGLLEFFEERLEPELANKVFHHKEMPRERVLQMLQPGAFAPHLGVNDTFSYACVEAIDEGLIPIVHDGNPMFEFLPPDLRHLALDRRMKSMREMRDKISYIYENASTIMAGIHHYCMETLQPDLISQHLAETYAEALEHKRGRQTYGMGSQRVSADDITVLVPVHEIRPQLLRQTLKALAAQTTAPKRVLLCLDGQNAKLGPNLRAVLQTLPNAKVVKQPKAGEAATLNTLAERCDSQLALILKPGEKLEPSAIQFLIDVWNAMPLGNDALIVPNSVAWRQDTRAHQLLDRLTALRLDELQGLGALVRTSILKSIGFDTTRRNGERNDWGFWLSFDQQGYKSFTLHRAELINGRSATRVSKPFPESSQIGTQIMLREITMENQKKP